MTPTAWDAICNPTAYRRWRDATAAGTAIRTCGCPADARHESHCDSWVRWTET